MVRPAVALVTCLVLASGCGSDDEPATETGAAPTTTAADASRPVVDGRFAVPPHGRRLAMLCYGNGSPAVVLVPGSDGSGIEEFALLMRPLAERTTTCAYDRLGAGRSDPVSERRRTMDDVVADLDGLVDAAEVPPPYVLVGASAGGGIVLRYAERHPRRSAAVVLLDVGADDAEALAKEFPGPLAWNNAEHVDWVDGARRLSALPPLSLGDIPLRVVTATEGQSSVTNQSVWLKLSSRARQTTVAGEHDLASENPTGVVAEIESLLDAVNG